ncbi:MAG: alpha/beta hydrolase [Saccharofermentanales bacterium]
MNLIRTLILKNNDLMTRIDKNRLARQTMPPGVEISKDIPYLGDGNPMHLLNVYRPVDTQGKLPVIINIHGGGWIYGSKELNRNYCGHLALHHYAVVGMSYRLLPECDLQGQIRDLFASLRWIAENATNYGFDLERVFICGDSAGGHLAGLVTCIQTSGRLAELYSIRPVPFAIKAVGIGHGVCDATLEGLLKGVLGKLVNREIRSMMIGDSLRPAWINAMSFQKAAAYAELPPIYVIGSMVDGFHVQTTRLVEFLKARGTRFMFQCWGKGNARLGHVFNVIEPSWPESRQTNRSMVDYFSRVE